MCMNGWQARTCGSRQRPGEILAFLLIQNRGGAASKFAVEVTKNRVKTPPSGACLVLLKNLFLPGIIEIT